MAFDIKILISAAFGFFGGLVRGLVGMKKAGVFANRKKFELNRLLFTLIASGLIGAFTGMALEGDYKFALLAGYGGTDLLEGITKKR